MGSNPAEFKGPNHPVDSVSWADAQSFVRALNAQIPALNAILPTEARWEYACRAGSDAPRYGELDAIAWHHGNADGQTHPVRQKQPNAWGLYDMLGNVWEWCHDGMHSYDHSHAYDPIGPMHEGTRRVLRGGSWSYPARDVRAAFRDDVDPSLRYSLYGFRLSRGQGAPSPQAVPEGRGERPGPRGTRGQGADPVPETPSTSWFSRLFRRGGRGR